MRFRQIHLDFHTNGEIKDIGRLFDPKAFGQAWVDANVDSVTLFSKCCHGWSYHPTQVGSQHPHLAFDLLRAQMDALHARNIRTPIYLTANWDNLAAFQHPEWRTVSPEGTLPATESGWIYLDFCSGYLDYFCAQLDEVMRLFPDGDGFFIDMAIQIPSISAATQTAMDAAGLDWTDPNDRATFTEQQIVRLMDEVTTVVRRNDPTRPVFFNSGHVSPVRRNEYKRYFSHVEIESLPTAQWGYEHFPLTARYIDPLGMDFLGMTGKFHFHWGEMGAWKKPDALIYECGAMLAQGARCSIGDHLHPSGRVDASTVTTIAPAYAWVREREPWALGSVARRQIALLTVEAAMRDYASDTPQSARLRNVASDEGAVRALLESRAIFDVIDPEADLMGYQLLILPDAVPVDAALRDRIEAFVAGGGRVLLTGKSGIDPDKGFLFDVGGIWEGPALESEGCYILPIPELQSPGIVDPLFVYAGFESARATDGRSLGQLHKPLIRRTERGFSGHLHAPVNLVPEPQPAGLAKGGFVWLATPLFSAYRMTGGVALLDVIEASIAFALDAPPLVKAMLPRAGRATLRSQPAQQREVLHLLYATPVLRGSMDGIGVQPIQDLVTLQDIAVTIRPERPVLAVRTVPEGEALAFSEEAGAIRFTVPRLRGHQMIECTYSPN